MIGARLKEDAAFTLVEMLLSLALLSMLSTFMVMGLRFSSQVKSAEARADILSSIDGVQRHLRRTISGAQAFTMGYSEQANQLSFEGTSQALSLTAPLDDRVAIGGLYQLRYEMDGEKNLALIYQLFRFGENAQPARSIVILENIEDVAFRYLSANGWRDSWSNASLHPDAVEINVTFPAGDQRIWSPLVVSLPLANQ